MGCKALKYWVHSYSQSTNYTEKDFNWKIFVPSFWKGERSQLDSKQNKWLSRSGRSKGFYKQVFWEISQIFTRKHLGRSLFFDKVRRCRSATSFKRDSSTGSFCEFCEICKNTFLQNTTIKLFLIIAVTIVVKVELANETVNYDTEIKTYQLESAV